MHKWLSPGQERPASHIPGRGLEINGEADGKPIAAPDYAAVAVAAVDNVGSVSGSPCRPTREQAQRRQQDRPQLLRATARHVNRGKTPGFMNASSFDNNDINDQGVGT